MVIIIIVLVLLLICSCILAQANSKFYWLAGVLILLLGLSISKTLLKPGHKNPEEYSLLWEESIGYRLAQAVSDNRLGDGTLLLLDNYDSGATNDLAESHYLGFIQGLGNTSSRIVKVRASDINKLKEAWASNLSDDMRPNQEPIDLSLQLFKEVIKNESPVSALVTFVGLPADMSATDLKNLPPTFIYGLDRSTNELNDNSLLSLHSIRAIIQPKEGTRFSTQPKKKELIDVFNERYQLSP